MMTRENMVVALEITCLPDLSQSYDYFRFGGRHYDLRTRLQVEIGRKILVITATNADIHAVPFIGLHLRFSVERYS